MKAVTNTTLEDGYLLPHSDEINSKKRRICEGCGRPSNTCLCTALPRERIPLTGHVIVIRHPNEKSKALATIPILTKCVRNISVVHARKFKAGLSDEVDKLIQTATKGDCPLYLLFPGKGSVPLDQLSVPQKGSDAEGDVTAQNKTHYIQAAPSMDVSLYSNNASTAVPSVLEHSLEVLHDVVPLVSYDKTIPVSTPDRTPSYLLVAVDGTWREAKEMWRAVSEQLLPPNGPGIQVTLPPNGPGVQVTPPTPTTASLTSSSRHISVPDTQNTHHPNFQQDQDASCLNGNVSRNLNSISSLDSTSQLEASPTPIGPDLHSPTNHPPSCPSNLPPNDISMEYNPFITSGDSGQGLGFEAAGPCLIRTEPVEGYLTTYEALCKALVILEGERTLEHQLMEGERTLEHQLMEPLRLMTRHQARHDPAVAGRCQWAVEEGAPQLVYRPRGNKAALQQNTDE
ncbi:hypothetical protein CEUSTIGMA_g1608.t1 [Chlamydomonas eustigma]|uniref:tRNA-uridine aminocarboxypropyltransferase n=1 Tax=Chlamydomonas eustigma TaxID=1157962 RepID=A0A250WTU1_9CHLO|nr:hypothetical protein CEUSTIGMA_g1608.t1 [Chlamydomonas eustigma]|eukprot:GAX74159.1 hypothetical protein CEUSTIGMA_g1608.t1 [Chlamydomonas eustigma]